MDNGANTKNKKQKEKKNGGSKKAKSAYTIAQPDEVDVM